MHLEMEYLNIITGATSLKRWLYTCNVEQWFYMRDSFSTERTFVRDDLYVVYEDHMTDFIKFCAYRDV